MPVMLWGIFEKHVAPTSVLYAIVQLGDKCRRVLPGRKCASPGEKPGMLTDPSSREAAVSLLLLKNLAYFL